MSPQSAYALKRRPEGKGFALANECRVMEICNPGQASEVLSVDSSGPALAAAQARVWHRNLAWHNNMLT